MSDEWKVRAPGRVIIAIALVPFTAILAFMMWSAAQSGSPITALREQEPGLGGVVYGGLYLVGLFIVVTGRIPFARTSPE